MDSDSTRSSSVGKKTPNAALRNKSTGETQVLKSKSRDYIYGEKHLPPALADWLSNYPRGVVAKTRIKVTPDKVTPRQRQMSHAPRSAPPQVVIPLPPRNSVSVMPRSLSHRSLLSPVVDSYGPGMSLQTTASPRRPPRGACACDNSPRRRQLSVVPVSEDYMIAGRDEGVPSDVSQDSTAPIDWQTWNDALFYVGPSAKTKRKVDVCG